MLRRYVHGTGVDDPLAVFEGSGVAELVGGKPGASFVLVGHLKDASSGYLQHFAGWALDSAEAQGKIDASSLRDAYFGNAHGSLEAALAALVSQAPASTLEFLRAWAALPHYREMAAEWASLKEEKAKWACHCGSPKCVGTMLRKELPK